MSRRGLIRLSAYILHTFLRALICPRTGADRKALQQYQRSEPLCFFIFKGLQIPVNPLD